MKRYILRLVEYVAPLPMSDRRKEVLVPIRWVYSGFILKRDWDFLCYLLFIAMSILALLVTFGLCVDLGLKSGVIISTETFKVNKLAFLITSSSILGPAGFILFFIFYLRARLFMNIKYSKIPYMTGIKHLKNKSKYIWLQVYSALALAALGMIFLSHLAPVQITLHYGMQNSFLFISITYVLQLVCLIYGPQLLMHSTLMLEKIFRFYPSVEADYRNMESVSQEQW